MDATEYQPFAQRSSDEKGNNQQCDNQPHHSQPHDHQKCRNEEGNPGNDKNSMTLLGLSLACGINSTALGKLLAQLHREALSLQELETPAVLQGLLERAEVRGQTGNRICHWMKRHGPSQSLQWYRQQLCQDGWQMVSRLDRRFPVLLNQISDCPGVLYAKGDVALLSEPQIAMVGSRSPSADGLQSARLLASQISAQGVCVTSGLALGVDQMAHRGALQGKEYGSGSIEGSAGKTIAVLGSGAGDIYPKRNGKLAQEIVQSGGLLVTEFPPGLPPQRQQFPLRNRVISGMSLAVIVVEAAIKSGSLITARLAAQQGREVFAVPGSIHNPLSQGCHQLIKEGAQLMDRYEDLVQGMEGICQLEHCMTQCSSDSVQDASVAQPAGVLQHFTGGLNSLDQLVEISGMQAEHLLVELSRLEAQGKIERVAGGYLRKQW